MFLSHYLKPFSAPTLCEPTLTIFVEFTSGNEMAIKNAGGSVPSCVSKKDNVMYVLYHRAKPRLEEPQILWLERHI